MAETDRELERRQETLRRWGPYALLGAGTLLAATVAPELTPTAAGRGTALALVAAAVLLQLWFERSGRAGRDPDMVSAGYYTVRWALSFALTWVNPFFAFYAAVGYFDVNDLIPTKRWRWLGPFACSIPLAGSQAGGMPFHETEQWTMFAGLLLVNNVLLTIVSYFAEHEEMRSRTRAATIAELERTNTALQQALDENAALQAQLLVQAREAGIADERRRLAAEIHDTIAQGLTGIIAQLRVVAGQPDPAAAHEHLDRASDLARHSLSEARRSVQNLAPMGLANDGLLPALRKTITRWAEQYGTRADFTLTGKAQQLHGEVSATLLRITQEALSNAAKHAAASRVGVTLSFMDGEVALDIRDDGRGFDPRALPERSGTGGFGLDGMRARAERIAGSLTVESQPGYGTAVSSRLPLV
ncbi:sensor histidine kinase [Streptomyces sp. MP131-18]|uniref:sensor histidine kinase n=1 Tax=Streptomyces sp. MP131-18 TaxID=1857892 RepID=UPI00097C8F2B|nr:sensor histidine kinase [Streptomyces sp. MP131-18]